MRTSKGRIKLKGIGADAFTTAADRAALENLKQVPILPKLIQKFSELAVERVLYVQNTSSSVRCSSRQLPTLHKLLKEACKILDTPEPELYVRYHVVDNALTAGIERTFIVVNSPIVNSLSDDELMFVLGHELGHIKCQHLLYRMVGQMLIPMLEALGKVTMGLSQVALMGVFAAYYEWMRQAEITCDRAGLLVCQDPRVALSAIMKVGGGSTRLTDEMNVDEFLHQAREYVDHTPQEGLAKALVFLLYKWSRSHPDIVHRAKAIDEWARVGSYEEILAGSYARKEE